MPPVLVAVPHNRNCNRLAPCNGATTPKHTLLHSKNSKPRKLRYKRPKGRMRVRCPPLVLVALRSVAVMWVQLKGLCRGPLAHNRLFHPLHVYLCLKRKQLLPLAHKPLYLLRPDHLCRLHLRPCQNLPALRVYPVSLALPVPPLPLLLALPQPTILAQSSKLPHSKTQRSTLLPVSFRKSSASRAAWRSHQNNARCMKKASVGCKACSRNSTTPNVNAVKGLNAL
jgi:hypothetical protein